VRFPTIPARAMEIKQTTLPVVCETLVPSVFEPHNSPLQVQNVADSLAFPVKIAVLFYLQFRRYQPQHGDFRNFFYPTLLSWI
jgi:hypothetical protein